MVSPYGESLLIFADETVLSYLPFLAIHYGNVTVVNLEQATPEQIASLSLDGYDQVLFAYSVNNILNRPVSAAAAMVRSNSEN